MEGTKSKNNLIALLHFIRDCELDKPLGKCNEELVDACVKLLLKLQNKSTDLTAEQVEDKVRKIPFVISADFNGNAKNNTNKKTKKHTTKKKILLVAAIIALLCALLAVFSIGYNLDYWHNVMNERFGSVSNVPIGEIFVEGNEEFVINGINVFYENVKDFRRKEKSNVLLPSELPDNTSITRIQISEVENKIYVSFNSVITSYEINCNTSLPTETTLNLESYITNNGIICYIDKINESNIVQIYFEYNGNTYIIGGTDKQILLDIINNLEELE